MQSPFSKNSELFKNSLSFEDNFEFTSLLVVALLDIVERKVPNLTPYLSQARDEMASLQPNEWIRSFNYRSFQPSQFLSEVVVKSRSRSFAQGIADCFCLASQRRVPLVVVMGHGHVEAVKEMIRRGSEGKINPEVSPLVSYSVSGRIRSNSTP